MDAAQKRDLGLFAPNYDIDADRVDEYLEWLHGDHLPRTLAEGSFSAISHYEAVNAPKRFQLLEVMPEYTSFHSAGRFEAAKRLPANVSEMMALRRRQVRNLYAAVSWVKGASDFGAGGGVAIGPAVYLMRFDVPHGDRPDFNAWLSREHFRESAKIEGLISFRRYIAVEGGPVNLLLYEFESVDAIRTGGVERSWSTPWAVKIASSLTHDENSKVVYRRIWAKGKDEK